MPYKTRIEMEEDDFIEAGQDLLNKTVLNWPHNTLANNLDITHPIYDVLSAKTDEDYRLGRIYNNIPSYDDPATGQPTYYVTNGQTFKEAIATLDRATRDLRNFILTKTVQPSDVSPFITPGDIVVPPGGTASTQWYLVPDEVIEPPKGEAIGYSDYPICRIPQMPPRIYIAGYNNNPRHLIGITQIRRGGDLGIIKLMESFDGGVSWGVNAEFGRDAGSGINTGASAGFLWGDCTPYKKQDGTFDFGYGQSNYSLTNKWRGTGTYNESSATWSFTTEGYSNSYEHVYPFAIRTSQGPGKSIGAWTRSFSRYMRIGLYNSHFSDYSTGPWPAGFVEMINPSTGTTVWNTLSGPSVVEAGGTGVIFIAFGGRETAVSNWRVYVAYSIDNGVTFTTPTAVLSNAAYHYTGPSLVQVANGGLALSFSTNEGQSDLTNIRTVKLAVSYDGINWTKKTKVYEQGNLISGEGGYYDLGLHSWPTSKLLQLGNGEVICFIEAVFSLWDRRLIRARMKLEV
jgi:hypothetical protein